MKFNFTVILAVVMAIATKLQQATEDNQITVNELFEIAQGVVQALGIGDHVVVKFDKKEN